jgi:hypothetical protein
MIFLEKPSTVRIYETSNLLGFWYHFIIISLEKLIKKIIKKAYSPKKKLPLNFGSWGVSGT